VCAFIGTDLGRDIVKDGFFFGKADLGASLRSAAVWGIVPIRGAFGSDTKTRNRLASGRVRVKLGLKIFQVKSKVQNIDFLKFVFRHADPPISGWQLRWPIWWHAIRSPPCAGQQEAPYFTLGELLQCDCHRSEYLQVMLARLCRLCFRIGTRQRVRDVITTARQT